MTTPDFSTATISIGETGRDALVDGRILTSYALGVHFVVAHQDDREQALTMAAQISGDETTEGDGPAYTVLVPATMLLGLARATYGHGNVYDAQDHHADVGFINLANTSVTEIHTTHGTLAVEPVLSEDINAGDVIINGEGAEDGTFTLHYATTGYDPGHEAITHRPYDSHEMPQTYEYGPHQMVYRVLSDIPALV